MVVDQLCQPLPLVVKWRLVVGLLELLLLYLLLSNYTVLVEILVSFVGENS